MSDANLVHAPDGRVLGVIYRHAISTTDLRSLLRAHYPTPTTAHGGWRKGPVPARVRRVGKLLAGLAHTAAEPLGRPVARLEHLELHRHPVGSTFPPHVDRMDTIPPEFADAISPAARRIIQTRSANVVAMLHPADAGGTLRLWPEPDPAEPITPELDAGDVIVFDGATVHEVTRVGAGERLTLVTHAHDA